MNQLFATAIELARLVITDAKSNLHIIERCVTLFMALNCQYDPNEASETFESGDDWIPIEFIGSRLIISYCSRALLSFHKSFCIALI